MTIKTVLASGAALAALAAVSAHAQTIETIQDRGELICGVNTGLPGFSSPDSEGNWNGLDVDVCRAVAAAVLGDSQAVAYVPLTAQQRFTALQSGEVDLLSRNTTQTLTRDTSVGLHFAPVTYYDGQGFMVPVALGVTSALELEGATVCVQQGTTTELNLSDFFRANNMTFQPVVIESFDETNSAFFSGRCDVYTTDASGMASVRSTIAPNPADYVILPEIISKEPLAPAVRHGDDQWLDVVSWVVRALITAEELGITSENIDSFAGSSNPAIQRLLGETPGMGEALGLPEDWAANAISQVGNYGEIFENNVGVDSPLGLERGLNALWTEGGLMYAAPIR